MRQEPPFDEEAPPIFTTWNQLYCFVLVLHLIIICLFYWLTKTYS
ncbi:MAG: hypothetical protein AB8G15_01360 [Saprospiraceae bacterium]